ncbi:U11/U12 small nuclear ribonucleoprotein 25 kDa protein [Citrus sinensis]|uniref:U11/U12 small nuclear ribonucleoprotein 25 kDa protein n=1 Tax=Citrus sinensis TaxID=2711 RepID=A0ACB8KY15_CITSI|nr:U11/U12 small nuclear ribonucleoprotein 25 kDa protein [Citrus sinensis]
MESSSSCGAKEEEVEVGDYNSSTMKKARLHSTLTALLDDPILADVPKKPTLSDVDTLISLEMGSAMRISILKLDGTSFDVAVMNSATVKDLKLAIKKKVNDMEQSNLGSMSGRIIACLTKIRSYLMKTLPFKIVAYVTIPRCSLYPLSCQKVRGSIQRGGNTESFVVLAS